MAKRSASVNFVFLWKAGPKEGHTTEVGCGDLCFLSPEQPKDHPILKDLLGNPTGADRLEESPKKVQPLTKLKERKAPSSTLKQRTAKTKSVRNSVTDAKMLLSNSSPQGTRKKVIPRKEDQADCMINKQPHYEKMLQTDMPEEFAGQRKNKRKLLKMLGKELEGDPQQMNFELVVDITRDMVGGGKLHSVTSDLAAEKISNIETEEIQGRNGHCKVRKNKFSAEAKSDSALSEENVPNTLKASPMKGVEIPKLKDNWQSRRSRSANKVNSVSKHPCRPKTPPPANFNKNDKVLSRPRKAPGEGSIDLKGETSCKDQKQLQTSPVELKSRMLLIENMEADVSAFDALEILRKKTEGICAVHVMPKREFEPSTIGYAVYKNVESAQTALSRLLCGNFIVVGSGKGR